ncbi:hypothetical protein MRX96_035534 [Rhipicephalus microplus]
MDDSSDVVDDRLRSDSIATEDAALAFDIEELDDKEFELPPVENPPTLESILNEVDGGSLSDEEVPNQALFHGNCDSVSLASADSRNLPTDRVSARPSSILRHVILRGVSSQLRSAMERVDSGKPTAMAVSSLIAVGTFHGLVLVFDPEQALKWCLGSIQLGEQYGSVSAMGFNGDCSRLLCGYAKGQLTMWDLSNGKLLRTITDIHPPQMAILHVKFTDDPTLAICSDSGGSVYELNFRKVLNSRTCDSVCIFSGSRGEVCAMEPLHVSPEVSRHPAQEVSLLALATVTKVIVVTVRPVLRVRFTHSLRADPNTLPLLSWQFVVIQVSASTRIIDPVLAFGRQGTIYFFQVNIPSFDKMVFVPLQKIQVQYTVQNFTWLNSRTFVALDTSENLHVLDVRSQEELEVLDMSDVQMVYGTSHFKGHATGGNVSKAMVAAAERACYHSMAGCGAQVLLLGLTSVHVLSLRTWLERLELLYQQQQYAEALRLTCSLYRDEAKAVCGLVGKKVRRQHQVATYAQQLLEALAAGPPDRIQPVVPLCVQLALLIKEHVPDILDKLYTMLPTEVKGKFLDSLPVHLLDGELRSPSPALAKDLVSQLASMDQFELLERCLVCLDVACLDLHQVMTLCWKHSLYDGIIYVHNQALNDFTTPIKGTDGCIVASPRVWQAADRQPVDQAHLLDLAEQARFYRVCEYLYEKQRLYHKVFLCYLNDPSRELQSFDYAVRIFASPNVSEKEKALLEDQLVNSLEALMKVDSRATSQLMLQHLAHRVDDIMRHLEGQPKVLYQFLKGVWNSREASSLTQSAKDTDSMTAAVQEQYTELMCQFEPDAVAPFLVSAEGYRIEETLEICRRHNVLDATAYLLEKTGDVHGALHILLQVLDEKLQACAQQGPMREQLLQEARVRLQAVVQLCQRSCPFLSAAEREALWFPVLERVMAPQRQLRSALGADKDFLSLTHQLLGSMMGFVALPNILHKLMQDPAYNTGKFGEVRHFVMKMLDTHNYEKALLRTTNRLLSSDVHMHLRQLKAAANRAYVSHTAACVACNRGFFEPGGVVMFRCSHCYHKSCLAALGPGERASEVYCQRCRTQPLGQPLECPTQVASSTSRSLPDTLLPVLLKDNLQLHLAPARSPDIKLDI